MPSPSTPITCNSTIYQEWHDAPFEDAGTAAIIETELLSYALRRDEVETWNIMNFDETQLDYRRGKGSITNGQAMELSTVWCRNALSALISDLAGAHGPVSEQELHDAMCNYCYLGDDLRVEAMNLSQCNCIELSTTPDDIAYTKEGDFCLASSGRILCNVLGRCSDEDCALRDFTCPRREYDGIDVPMRGLGGQCSGGVALSSSWSIVLVGIVAIYSIIRW